MSNMSYCRFQNTCGDLSDCADALESLFNTARYADDQEEALSDDELRAAKRLLALCERINDMTNADELDKANAAVKAGVAMDDNGNADDDYDAPPVFQVIRGQGDVFSLLADGVVILSGSEAECREALRDEIEG